MNQYSYWFSFLFPWLLVLWLLHLVPAACRPRALTRRQSTGNPVRQFGSTFGLAILSAILILLPVGGLPAGRWLAALNLPPSVPLLALLAGQVWKNAFKTEVFRLPDRQAGWVFGSLAGLALYPMALGLGRFDPYGLGWQFSPLFGVIALATLALVWKRNRFGLLLLGSLIAYDLRLLDTTNFWDYLVDPVYWLLCLTWVTRAIVRKARLYHSGRATETACSSATAK